MTTESKLSWAAGSYALQMRAIPRQKVDFKWRMLLPPKHRSTGKRFSGFDGKSYLVTSTAKKRDSVEESADLAMFVGGTELQDLNLKHGGCEPNRESILNSDAFAPKEVRDVFLESNKVRRPHPFERSVYFRAWQRAIQATLDKMIDGQVPVKEGLAQAAEVGDKMLRGEEGASVV